jgi:prephenate dehydrogenase
VIDHLVVIGVGLIGGSFALDLKKKGLVGRITGVGRGRANLEKARELGIIDAIAEHAGEAVADADLVMIAIPVGAMAALFRDIAPTVPPRCILTDAGSTKQDVIAVARAGLGEKIARFVPGHPIAGAETSGAEAARSGLFQRKPCILTPLPENRPQDVDAVQALWKACGAQVTNMEPMQHDKVYAAVSHLPHLVAFALMDELAGRPQRGNVFPACGQRFSRFHPHRRQPSGNVAGYRPGQQGCPGGRTGCLHRQVGQHPRVGGGRRRRGAGGLVQPGPGSTATLD